MQGNSTCPVTVPRDKRATRLVPLCLCLKSRCAALGSRLGWTCSAHREQHPSPLRASARSCRDFRMAPAWLEPCLPAVAPEALRLLLSCHPLYCILSPAAILWGQKMSSTTCTWSSKRRWSHPCRDSDGSTHLPSWRATWPRLSGASQLPPPLPHLQIGIQLR